MDPEAQEAVDEAVAAERRAIVSLIEGEVYPPEETAAGGYYHYTRNDFTTWRDNVVVAIKKARGESRRIMSANNDDLGNRMKAYEGVEAQRKFLSLLPVVARLDGKCFSSFTRGLARPFDKRLSKDSQPDRPLNILSDTPRRYKRSIVRVCYRRIERQHNGATGCALI